MESALETINSSGNNNHCDDEFLSKSSGSTISTDSSNQSIHSKISSTNDIISIKSDDKYEKTIDYFEKNQENNKLETEYNISKETEYSLNPVSNKIEPKIGFIFLMLGISNMFPFQSFLASLDYLSLLFPDWNIASTFPFVYMASVCFVYVLLVKFQGRLRIHLVLLIGFPISMVIMIIAPIINIANDKGTITTYVFTLLLIAICAFVDATIQGHIFSLAGIFGYTIFVQFGIGIAGVIILITRLICKLSFSNDINGLKIGSIVFFAITVVIVLIGLLSFIYFLRLPIGKIVLKKKEETKSETNNEKEITTTISANGEHPLKYVLKKNWQYTVIVCYVFLISFFLFPGIVIQTTSNRIRVDWFIFIMIAMYNISDCIGKCLPVLFHHKWIPSIKIIWTILIGRTVFIALFFLGIYTTIFKHEAWVLSFIFIFGLTNGYIASYALSVGPTKIERKFKGLCAILLSSSLNLGLLIGTSLNLLVVSVQ